MHVPVRSGRTPTPHLHRGDNLLRLGTAGLKLATVPDCCRRGLYIGANTTQVTKGSGVHWGLVKSETIREPDMNTCRLLGANDPLVNLLLATTFIGAC